MHVEYNAVSLSPSFKLSTVTNRTFSRQITSQPPLHSHSMHPLTGLNISWAQTAWSEITMTITTGAAAGCSLQQHWYCSDCLILVQPQALNNLAVNHTQQP